MWGTSSFCICASLMWKWECFGHLAFCRAFWTGKEPTAASFSWDGEAHFTALLKVYTLGMHHASGCNQNPSKHHLSCPHAWFLQEGNLAPWKQKGSHAAFSVWVTGEAHPCTAVLTYPESVQHCLPHKVDEVGKTWSPKQSLLSLSLKSHFKHISPRLLRMLPILIQKLSPFGTDLCLHTFVMENYELK